MDHVGIKPSMLTGARRARMSRRRLRTMTELSDPYQYFAKALRTELEHGSVNQATDVTHDDPRATARIVAAHIFGVEHGERPLNWRFFPAYYDYLWNMEKTGPRV
jgi:hypothetical protein